MSTIPSGRLAGRRRKILEISGTPTPSKHSSKRSRLNHTEGAPHTSSSTRSAQPTPTTPPPRFCTTFKTFSEPSTSVIHKTRCPCTALKELKREREELQQSPSKHFQAIREINIKIGELEKTGCTVGHEEVTLTRSQIEKNKAMVAENTLHGKVRRRNEFFAEEAAERKEGIRSEEYSRSDIGYRWREHMETLHAQSDARFALGFAEEESRRSVISATEDSLITLFELFHYTQREYAVHCEGVQRGGIWQEEGYYFACISSMHQLIAEEAAVRDNAVGCYARNVVEMILSRRAGIYRTLSDGERLQRGVIYEAEADSCSVISTQCTQNLEHARWVFEGEGQGRRHLCAEESYGYADILGSAGVALPQALCHAEENERRVVASSEASVADHLFGYSECIVFTLRGVEEHVERGVALLSESQAELAWGQEQHFAEHRAIYSDSCLKELCAIAADRDTELRPLARFAHASHALVSCIDSEAAERFCLQHSALDYVVRAFEDHQSRVRSLVEMQAVQTIKSDVIDVEAAEFTVMHAAYLCELRHAVLREAELHIRHDIATRCANEVLSLHAEYQERTVSVFMQGVAVDRDAVAHEEEQVRRAVRLSYIGDVAFAMLGEAETRARTLIETECCNAFANGITLKLQDTFAAFDATYHRSLASLISEQEHHFNHVAAVYATAGSHALFYEMERSLRNHIEMECTSELEQGRAMWNVAMPQLLLLEYDASYRRLSSEQEMSYICELTPAVARVKADMAMLNNSEHEATKRAEVVAEEMGSRQALSHQHMAGMMLLAAELDDFKELKQWFNLCEQQHGIPYQWNVGEGRELACAANTDMMSLLRHCKVLCRAYDQHLKDVDDHHYQELSTKAHENTKLKAELSKKKNDIEDLQMRQRDTALRFGKLKEEHAATKQKNDQLTRSNRAATTAAANQRVCVINRAGGWRRNQPLNIWDFFFFFFFFFCGFSGKKVAFTLPHFLFEPFFCLP